MEGLQLHLVNNLDLQPKHEVPARHEDHRQTRAFVWCSLEGERTSLFGAAKSLGSICKGSQCEVAEGPLGLVSLPLSRSSMATSCTLHLKAFRVVPKSVVFVIDVSGSMHGRKMEQVLFLVQGWVTDERHREIFLKWMKLIFQ